MSSRKSGWIDTRIGTELTKKQYQQIADNVGRLKIAIECGNEAGIEQLFWLDFTVAQDHYRECQILLPWLVSRSDREAHETECNIIVPLTQQIETPFGIFLKTVNSKCTRFNAGVKCV